jgi:hypothetical protein
MAHEGVGDAMHGPLVLAPDGRVRKSYLLTQIDDATRYIPHSYFALSESAAAQEYGLKQAILKYGIPRGYYVDLGSAYIAPSLRAICADLGIHLLNRRSARLGRLESVSAPTLGRALPYHRASRRGPRAPRAAPRLDATRAQSAPGPRRRPCRPPIRVVRGGDGGASSTTDGAPLPRSGTPR